jgi:tetratricopeptide (TPR) repeat protein
VPDVAAALARDGVLTPEALTRALGAARDGDVASAALRLGLATEGALVHALVRAEHRDEEALALGRQAVAQDPLSADAQYWLGHALSRQGLLFEAVAAFERASELRPELAVVHQCLALTYERVGFQRSARQEWAHAIEACEDPRRKKAMQAHLEKLLFL